MEATQLNVNMIEERVDGNRLTRYCRYDIILGVRGCGKEIWVYARWAGDG